MDINKFEEYITNNKKTKLIFDFDSTIAKIKIDWTEWHKGIAKVYKKYDDSFNDEGKGMQKKINKFVEKYGQPLKDEVVNFNYQFEKTFNTGLRENESLIKFIKDNKKYDLYVLTNNDSRNVRSWLKELNILDKFKLVVGGNDVKYIKPRVESIMEIINSKTNIDEFLMIGDNLISDKGVADASGVDFYLIDNF